MENYLKQILRRELFMNDFDSLYKFIKKNQFISLSKNGITYFYFVHAGKIYSISESLLSFVAFSVSFFGIVAFRKIFKKYEIGKNCKKKLQKLKKRIRNRQNPRGLTIRGGANYEDDILHYETGIAEDGRNYLPKIFSKLTSEERFVKGIIKKCLKQNRFYKISNRGLMEVIEQMMEFQKKDNTRIISYDVLILALLKYSEPMSPIIFEGTRQIAQKLGYSAFVKHAPLIISIIVGLTAGVSVNLQYKNILYSFFSAIPVWFSSFKVAESTRNVLAIYCTDYVQELPVLEKNLLSETNVDSNSKISVSLSKPTRHETFTSTSPGQELHFEERINIDSLDGFYKEGTKLNGEKTLTWKPHSSLNKPQVTENRHIPLKERTKTLADLRNLDSTNTRESAEKIRNQIEKEQILIRIVDEFLE